MMSCAALNVKQRGVRLRKPVGLTTAALLYVQSSRMTIIKSNFLSACASS